MRCEEICPDIVIETSIEAKPETSLQTLKVFLYAEITLKATIQNNFSKSQTLLRKKSVVEFTNSLLIPKLMIL